MTTQNITRRNFVNGMAAAGIGAAAAANAGLAPMYAKASENDIPETWDYEYDIVVCGAGGAGLIAALKAHDEGASVIVIDCNYEMGGHAAMSHGITHSGGGTSMQLKWGIEDSADQVYLDHTNPVPMDSRFNDRAIVREYANRSVECFEWMLSKGMKVVDAEPGIYKTYLEEGGTDCETVARKVNADPTGYVNLVNGQVSDGSLNGIAVTRPFEETARAEGIDFMFNRHMDALIQDESGRVVGVRASYTPRITPDGTMLVGLHDDENIHDETPELTFKATKAVIICTGGGMSNVAWRTMFDPRWTEEYDGVAGEPFSYADASGEIAGLAIGAGLGTTANWTVQCKWPFAACIGAGARYGYKNLRFTEESDVWPWVGAKGLYFSDFDGVVQVNLKGERFYNEEAMNGFYSDGDGMWDYFAAAFGSAILDEGTPEMRRVGGPLWNIFDAKYAAEQGWDCLEYPEVDTENGYFFSGETIEELATNIINKYYEDYPMDPEVLKATIERYNELVDAGVDEDFGKPEDLMTHKIETGPFYAAWSTPVPHDTLTGLRTNAHRQVLTVTGEPISGLYAAGESAGGMHTHGLGKVQTSGYIAGMYAVEEA